jgi:hypothetical protein
MFLSLDWQHRPLLAGVCQSIDALRVIGGQQGAGSARVRDEEKSTCSVFTSPLSFL